MASGSRRAAQPSPPPPPGLAGVPGGGADPAGRSVGLPSATPVPYASAASTVPLLATLLSLIRGLRPDLPHRRSKGRSCHGKSSWPVPQLPTADTDLGKHRRESRRHSPRCTIVMALMRALGRSRWPNGLCRGLHRGCTDGTGLRPEVGRTVNYSTPRGPTSRGWAGSGSMDNLGRLPLRVFSIGKHAFQKKVVGAAAAVARAAMAASIRWRSGSSAAAVDDCRAELVGSV